MHCTTEEHVEAVFRFVHERMEHDADDGAVARELGSIEALLTFGHVITREDLVAVFGAVRAVFIHALQGLSALLDRLLNAGWHPQMVIRWLDSPQGQQAVGRPVTVADLVGALRMAEAVAA